jgi:hypothetical protein
MLACIRMYLLGTLPSAGVLGGIPLGQYVPNLLVLNNYSMLSRLAHAYILGSRGPIPKLHCLSTCMLTISNNYPEQIHIEKCIDSIINLKSLSGRFIDLSSHLYILPLPIRHPFILSAYTAMELTYQI